MMTRFRILLFFALCLGVLGGARATSCRAMDNRFFFACDAEQCVEMFSVRDVAAFSACARHQQVEAIDTRVLARAAELVAKDRPVGSAGIFELKMTQAYWGASNEDPLDWIGANVVATVSKIGPDASPAAIAALRFQFESAARKAYWSDRLSQLAYWGSAATAFLLLIHSVQRFSTIFIAEPCQEPGDRCWCPWQSSCC
ncbi:hypothetical protein [Massilia sp. CF038]|uniref:hypothetical protein n=1 Tax=Massilia sp. CF038 TaxID=1881045 RepID=UPI000917CFAC|nr:hypothetical protein [Massilia sp. CF038]SHH70227.1 hypothetical protein SAMN05428948_5019 [Massilia sp. CF038]